MQKKNNTTNKDNTQKSSQKPEMAEEPFRSAEAGKEKFCIEIKKRFCEEIQKE